MASVGGARRLVVTSVVLTLLATMLTTGPLAVEAGARSCRVRPTAVDRARVRGLDSRPRLLADRDDFARVQRLTERDETAARWRKRLVRKADGLVGLAPTRWWRIGPRLQFHEYKDRVLTLAMAWRLERDDRYARQARREMLAAARFSSWNPVHYLDTAEMTAVTAIGYDWLFATLPPATRKRLRMAIINKGLRTSKCFYRRNMGPVMRHDNWGIVTNTGMALGALAVADTHPRLAAGVLGQAVRHVRPAFGGFGPDGAYLEGPHYWRYATEHAVNLTSSLQTSLGSSLGLASSRGFSRTGTYALHSVGPTGRVANFGDADERMGRAPQLFWLARRFSRPTDAWLRRSLHGAGRSPLDLLWYTAADADPKAAGLARSRVFRRAQSAYLRGRWNDPDATFVAVKGGPNWGSHVQPELGSFVMDSRGHRWAVDLGLDDYNLPGYWDPVRRARYYRLSTRGQNTLVIAGREQRRSGYGRIVRFRTGKARSATVMDLSSAYADVRSVRRGVALLNRRSVLVQDEVAGKRSRSVVWSMHTRAEVVVLPGQRTALLRRGRENLVVRILAPDTGARFAVESAQQRPPQARNEGVSRLVVRTRTRRVRPGGPARLRLAVLLAPVDAPADLKLRRLDDW